MPLAATCNHAVRLIPSRLASASMRPSSAASNRMLTTVHQQGAYNGRKAEWARQEADIIATGREGRIRNRMDVAGK